MKQDAHNPYRLPAQQFSKRKKYKQHPYCFKNEYSLSIYYLLIKKIESTLPKSALCHLMINGDFLGIGW